MEDGKRKFNIIMGGIIIPPIITVAIYHQFRVRETVANFPLESKDLAKANIWWVIPIMFTLMWLTDIFIKDQNLGRKFKAFIWIAALIAYALIFFIC